MDRQVMADLLRRTLEQKEIEQQELANFLGVHPTLVNKWAKRKNPAPIPCYHLPKIARFTGESRFVTYRKQNCPLYVPTADERNAREEKRKCG